MIEREAKREQEREDDRLVTRFTESQGERAERLAKLYVPNDRERVFCRALGLEVQ